MYVSLLGLGTSCGTIIIIEYLSMFSKKLPYCLMSIKYSAFDSNFKVLTRFSFFILAMIFNSQTYLSFAGSDL